MRGVTLIEIVIVVAVFGILSAIIAPSGGAWRAGRELESASAIVLDTLGEARERTLQSKNAKVYGVAIHNSDVVVFEGDTYSEGASSNMSYSLGGDILAVPTLTGGASAVVFGRLDGSVTATGTIELTHQISGVSRSITIYASGLVDE
ncbi:MAG: prepilin-type N-terminal cleavage/methylation domain-containing protein [bacterium]|nr:prepilin-type N-terminal cleavage/methylation domain-containing protein [bacterium]